MKVYRVEAKGGGGPYMEHSIEDKDGICMEWAHTAWHDDNCRTPAPSQDDLDEYGGQFGFRSKRALKQWFLKKWRVAMHKEGLRVSLYNANRGDVIHSSSGKQLIFSRRKAKRVSTLSLVSI